MQKVEDEKQKQKKLIKKIDLMQQEEPAQSMKLRERDFNLIKIQDEPDAYEHRQS